MIGSPSFAALADNKVGNKNTTINTEAWSPDKRTKAMPKGFKLSFWTLTTSSLQWTKTRTFMLFVFKVSGGSLLHPSTKLMCLLGTGSQATASIIDRQTLLNLCNIITPTIDNLQECSNKNKVKAVNISAKDGAVTYPGSASFLPAP